MNLAYKDAVAIFERLIQDRWICELYYNSDTFRWQVSIIGKKKDGEE